MLIFSYMKTIISLIHLARDFALTILPIKKVSSKYKFAFLVHSRSLKDVYIKYPIARYLPKKLLKWLILRSLPVVVSKVDGLRSLDTGAQIQGLVIGLPMTAEQMLNNRELALKRIIDAVHLAEKFGVEIVGLGAYTSSLSAGGLKLVNNVKASVTTGHAYTAYTVFEYVKHCVERFKLNKLVINVSIIGAGGSIGSSVAELLARDGYINLQIIEKPKNLSRIKELSSKLVASYPYVKITESCDVSVINKSHIIVTATNAAEALIYSKDLMPGAIVIDDAQPPDVAEDVMGRMDVLEEYRKMTETSKDEGYH